VPVVFCGLFPVDAAQFEDLRAAMGKLRLNDASFTYEMETSAALGFGFRCGFLGLLHLEIIQERLSREFNLDLIATAPSVIYRMTLTDGKEIEIHNPVDMPDVMQILEIQEPWIEATILTPDEYLGAVLKLCQDRRGEQQGAVEIAALLSVRQRRDIFQAGDVQAQTCQEREEDSQRHAEEHRTGEIRNQQACQKNVQPERGRGAAAFGQDQRGVSDELGFHSWQWCVRCVGRFHLLLLRRADAA